MKLLALTCLFLAGAAINARSEGEPLESVQRAKWEHRNYENPKYGISVVVRTRSKEEQKDASRGGTFQLVEVEGTKVSVSIQEDVKQVATIRVPLDAKTIEYLFAAKNEPDYVRFIAASCVTDSNLPKPEQLKLLQKGTKLPEASLRYYIWYQIREFKPQADVTALIPLGIRDPCLDIAHECLGRIVEDYDLRRADGTEIELTTVWAGSSLAYYEMQHREVYEVAKALRRKKPDLMPLTELAKIRDRAMPSDEWLSINSVDGQTMWSAKGAVSARDYFREYAAKVMAEQNDVAADPAKPDGSGH